VVVCYVVDVFDFHGSFLADMAEVVGRNPVILALNKVPLCLCVVCVGWGRGGGGEEGAGG
jgi:hypothetical protein